MAPTTVLVPDLVARAVAAHRSLADLAEAIDDEWTFVNDLHEAWAAWLDAVAAAAPDRVADDESIAAVDEAIAEIGAITDPHRAIDWLSTFPQVVLLALGEPA